MSSKKTFLVKLSGNLTKSELVSQIDFVSNLIKSKRNNLVEEVKVDFNSILNIDTYALVFVLHIERLCRLHDSKKLNVIWTNIPQNLHSFIELSSLTGHLDIR